MRAHNGTGVPKRDMVCAKCKGSNMAPLRKISNLRARVMCLGCGYDYESKSPGAVKLASILKKLS